MLEGILLGQWKDSSVSPPDKILINNTLVAARILIVPNWNSVYIPHKDEWLSKVWHILMMNTLTVINKLRFAAVRRCE